MLPAGRPSHIVVFRRPRPAHASVVARTLGIDAKPTALQAGCVPAGLVSDVGAGLVQAP